MEDYICNPCKDTKLINEEECSHCKYKYDVYFDLTVRTGCNEENSFNGLDYNLLLDRIEAVVEGIKSKRTQGIDPKKIVDSLWIECTGSSWNQSHQDNYSED